MTHINDDMTSTPRAGWEERLTAAARQLDYPPTPDIARRVRARLDAKKPARGIALSGWARAALIALVILAGLMAVPGVRAAVLDFIRVGAVRIFLAPTPTPAGAGVQAPVTATPAATLLVSPGPTFSLDDLDGETTLDDARARVGFPLLLPTYPSDLGPPDRVYLQYFGDNLVIMVWLDREQPGHVRMSLHALGPGANAFKTGARLLRELEINGQYAVWLDGPYMLAYRGGDADMRYLIDGRVLVWTVGEVTYRLEAGLAFEQAVKVAESVK